VTDEPSIFVVRQAGERTEIAFRDWYSSRELLFSPEQPSLLAHVRGELNCLVADHQCRVLAIDMEPVDFVLSPFLGLLVSLHREGVTIELLHPSELVRETLEVTKLNQVFVVRD
jgi:hypothetical protein